MTSALSWAPGLRFSALGQVPGICGPGPVFGPGRCTCGNERHGSELQCAVHVKREGSTQFYSKFVQGSHELVCVAAHVIIFSTKSFFDR